MSRLSRLSWFLVVPALLAVAAAPAYAAGGTFQQCVDQAINHNGEPPTCTQAPGGGWVASWPSDSPAGGGLGGFGVFALLAVLVGIGVIVWKVTTAQKLARQSGMDPGLATQMTLLTDNGLDATYLASSLRPRPDPASAATLPKDTATRLAELRGLLDQELVTQAEYDARRQQILDSV